MRLVIDASAIVAMAMDEPERPAFQQALANATEVLASPINLTEAGLVIVLRFGRFSPDEYDNWLSRTGCPASACRNGTSMAPRRFAPICNMAEGFTEPV